MGGEASPSFDGLGRAYNDGSPAAYYRTGGVSTEVAGFYQGDILPKVERHTANLLGHYDFSDAFKLSIDAKYAQNRTSSFGQYTGTYYYPISINNAFLPLAIRNAAIAAGTTDANGVFTPADIHINRDNLDYGRGGEQDLRRTYRGVLGATGRLSDHATYDIYYEYGRTDTRITKMNDRLGKQYARRDRRCVRCQRPDRLQSGEQPDTRLHPDQPFGPGPATPEQLAYFQVTHSSKVRITQQVASASVSGDFGQFFELPGGPVKFAFGGEYRRESSSFQPNDLLLNAAFLSV